MKKTKVYGFASWKWEKTFCFSFIHQFRVYTGEMVKKVSNSRAKQILKTSILSSQVTLCLSTAILQNPIEQNSPLNHSGSSSRQIILSSWQTPWTAHFSFPNCLVCADKDGFTQFYFLKKTTTLDIEITDFFTLGVKSPPLHVQWRFNFWFSFAVSSRGAETTGGPGERGEGSLRHLQIGPESHGDRQFLPTPPPSKVSPSPGCHPSTTIMGLSKAAFTRLLKRQISSIVSSLSAFSNHSHGFALFILIVLLIIRVILCLQLSQRSQGLAVSKCGLGRVCRLTPHSPASTDFPSVWAWPWWLLFFPFFLFIPSRYFPWAPPPLLLRRRLFVAILASQEVSQKQIHGVSAGHCWALGLSSSASVYLAQGRSTFPLCKVKLHFETASPFLAICHWV